MKDFTLGVEGQLRLSGYFDGIGDLLANKTRRASFAIYAMGLLGDGERKSVEPIAARACGDPESTDALHQRLLHFLVDSDWSDHGVRRFAAQHVVSALAEREPVTAWIIDDTGHLKQGKHSVGVQRQYTGSAGKVTNCQIGVSLSIATATEHALVDYELYLPRGWAEDPVRRKEARIPDDVGFQTKPELAVDMLRWAVEDGLPKGVVLADAAYGTSSRFRDDIRAMELDYAVGVNGPTTVWRLDALDRRLGDPISLRDLGLALGRGAFRRVTWREGSKKALWSRFAVCRVVPVHDDGHDPAVREDVSLVIEWPEGEPAPTKFFFATLPRSTSRKQLVRIIKERYRTERLYQDLKGELGLDHYEGRRYTGWHHHVSAVLACYAFVVAERVRAFPPSAGRTYQGDPIALAA